jgi:DHA1 family inner membrane transport protein
MFRSKGLTPFLLVASAGPFLTMTGILAVGPLLVPMAADLGVAPGAVGQLVTATVLTWGLSAPLVGPLSDRYGRRPALLVGLGLLAAAGGAGAAAPGYGALVAARVVTGAGAALVAPNCVALIADHFPPARRGRLLSISTMGIPLSTLVGLPALSLVAARAGWRAAFLASAVSFVLLAATVALAVPPRPRRPVAGYLRTLGAIRGARGAWLGIVIALLDRFSVTAVLTYLPAHLMAAYGIGLGEVASVLTVVALGMLAGQLAGGLVAERHDRLGWAAAALALAGLAAGPLFWLREGLGWSAALAVGYGVLNAVSRTPVLALVTELGGEARATLVGFWSLANQLGAAVGAAAGGAVIALGGFGAIGTLCLAAGLLAAAWTVALVREAPDQLLR